MSESEHSPAPWTCEMDGADYIIRDATGYQVAKGWHWGKDEHAANGHLIADAPTLLAQRDDLLAACVATRDWLLSFSVPPATTIREKEEVLATLRAAIAAARGA